MKNKPVQLAHIYRGRSLWGMELLSMECCLTIK